MTKDEFEMAIFGFVRQHGLDRIAEMSWPAFGIDSKTSFFQGLGMLGSPEVSGARELLQQNWSLEGLRELAERDWDELPMTLCLFIALSILTAPKEGKPRPDFDIFMCRRQRLMGNQITPEYEQAWRTKVGSSREPLPH